MENNKSSLFDTIVAILIAVAAVATAVIAWRASIVSDASGDADYAGLRASVNAEETHALNAVNGYEHFGAYTNYARYSLMGNTLADYLASNPNLEEQESYSLDRQRAEYLDLADANNDLFPTKFINRDGTYGLQREMGEMWADAAKEKDLNPDPQFKDADQLRTKSDNMLAMLAVMGVALVLYTLIEVVEGVWKYVFAGLGTVMLVAGTVAAIVFELAK